MVAHLAFAQGRFNVLDFGDNGLPVDRHGHQDVTGAFARAIQAANSLTSKGMPACIYVPAGEYRLTSNLPMFSRAGCIIGDGPTQSIIKLDRLFTGDLFAWSEAWALTTPGPTVVGVKIVGSPDAKSHQNALVFYDRNDEVFLDNIVVTNLPGRALYSGARKFAVESFLRESHMRSLRFFNDGAPGIPVVEFASEGGDKSDGSNEVKLSQVDIYGANGPSLVIRNAGGGHVRYIVFESLRIEGAENGNVSADLLTIGDSIMCGSVGNLTFTNLELIDPYRGFPAIRLTSPAGCIPPHLITIFGLIDGGLPFGGGLRIDAGEASSFHFSHVNTRGTNVTIGPKSTKIVLDGYGEEEIWSYEISPAAISNVSFPLRRKGMPFSQ